MESLILGSFYILCPRGELRANEYKIGSQSSLTIDPLIQSHFNRTLSILVILIGQSLLYETQSFDKIHLNHLKDKNVIELDLNLYGRQFFSENSSLINL